MNTVSACGAAMVKCRVVRLLIVIACRDLSRAGGGGDSHAIKFASYRLENENGRRTLARLLGRLRVLVGWWRVGACAASERLVPPTRAGCVERAVRRRGSAVYVVALAQARFRIGRPRQGPRGFVWLRAYAACTSLGALRESTRPMTRPIAAGAIQPRPIV